MSKLIIRVTPHEVATATDGCHSVYPSAYLGSAVDAILEGLSEFAYREPAELLEAMTDPHTAPFDLLTVCRDALRILSLKSDEDVVVESDEDFANRMRRTGKHGGDVRKWAGQVLTQMTNADPVRNPVAMNVAGTRVRYLGKVDGIEGKIGTLTGKKWVPEELGIECVGIEIDGTEWGIPSAVPLELIADLGDQHAEHDASEVGG